jgi:hypothetical protein
MFRVIFWDILPCKMIVDNHFTWQYIPEDNSEHHTRRRENLKSRYRNALLIPFMMMKSKFGPMPLACLTNMAISVN